MSIGNLFSAGANLVSGLLNGGSQNTTTTNSPWKPQQGYIRAGFADAANLYAGQRGSPYFGGPTYAGLNPQQMASLGGIYGYQKQGMKNSTALTGAGMGMLGAGSNALSDASKNLGNFDPKDPTGQTIRDASRYMDNPALNGAIDAASRDVTRNLSEVQLPGIARGADASGNLNSSRTGIAEGIAMRGAADRIGDIGATMRNDAYQNGLALAEQQRSTNQGDMLNAQYQSGVLGDRGVSQGFGGISGGQGLAYDNFDANLAAGGVKQGDRQGQMNANFAQWQGQQNQPWDLLGRYQGAITGNYGGTTSVSQAQPGFLQTAAGLASTGLGLYGSYKNLNQQYVPPKAGGLY